MGWARFWVGGVGGWVVEGGGGRALVLPAILSDHICRISAISLFSNSKRLMFVCLCSQCLFVKVLIKQKVT